MPDKSKFEREIDEILEKTDQGIPQQDSSKKRRTFEPFSPTVPKRNTTKRSSNISIKPGNVIIAGLLLLAVAAFTPVAKVPIALVGIVLLIFGYILWFRTGASRFGGGGFSGNWRGRSSSSSMDNEPPVKYWRGRRIEDKPKRQRGPSERGKIIEFGSSDEDDEK